MTTPTPQPEIEERDVQGYRYRWHPKLERLQVWEPLSGVWQSSAFHGYLVAAQQGEPYEGFEENKGRVAALLAAFPTPSRS